MTAAIKSSICIGCGCDDLHACVTEGFLVDEPCSWVEVDRRKGVGVCSACPTSVNDALKRWRRGDRALSPAAKSARTKRKTKSNG